eukprot:SAG31_NODE_4206_length_3474_cov_2.060741_1_plen_580_part_01
MSTSPPTQPPKEEQHLSILRGTHDPALVLGKCVHDRIDEQVCRCSIFRRTPIQFGPHRAPMSPCFTLQALLTPASIAIVDGERSWNFKQLKADSDALGWLLQERGIVRGDVVGSYLPHCAEYIITNLAIFKAGAAIFPLETTYPSDLIEQLVEMAAIKFIITTPKLHSNLPAKVCGDTWSFILNHDWHLHAPRNAPTEFPQMSLHDVAYVTMTSGSTGVPKGIVNKHISAVCDFCARLKMLPYTAGDREGFNVFFIWEALRPLLAGYPAYVISDEIILDPRKLVKFIEENRITRLMTTPNLLEMILEHPGLNLARQLQSVRFWYVQGEPAPASLVGKFTEKVRTTQLYNIYGTWECLNVTYGLLTVDSIESKFAPVGVPQHNVTVYLLDEDMNVVPRGDSGEIFVDTPMLAVYLGDPDRTIARFPTVHANGKSIKMYRTGDLGCISQRTGQLDCLGRIDSTVKIRGYKVSIPFVESTISEQDSVTAVAVMPLSDENGKVSSLIAYLVGSTSVLMSDEELSLLKTKLKNKLPDFATPDHWVVLESLPTKPGESRKIDRQALPPYVPDERSQRTAGPARSHS